MKRFFRVQSPARLISLGFAVVILLGSALLMLPCSVRDGAELKYIDALYTSTSAVCVTGLIAVDAGDTFTPFGQFILALLIQIGGLGITSIGAGIMLAMGKKIDLKSRRLIQEASNLDSNRGAVRFIRSVLRTTLIFELAGAILSFLVFVQDYPPLRAMGISLFHSVAAFNNSGFDILGNYQNLIPYQNSVMLNLTTCGLVFFGGIGFLVIREMAQHKLKWRKYSMHAKVVLSVSGALILAGTLLLRATEDISWLGAFFHSVSARTAGFSTYPLKAFSNAGLLVLTALMFIGASPASTGGGIKTTTAAIIVLGIYIFQGLSITAPAQVQTIEWIKVIPYIIVLGTAIAGMNVMLVLIIGILTSGIIGIATGSFGVFDWFGAMGTGITGMGELIIITLLAGGMLETIRYNGGIDFIIKKLTRHVNSKRGAELSIAALVSIANLCTANNTIAIITTGPIAKDIAKRFHLDRRKTASILDTFSCLIQGIIPYGAQMLIAAGLANISPISIIGNLYYPFTMGICALLAILFRYPRRYS